MARTEYIRGTRSKAPYGYTRQELQNKPRETHFLAWTLLILLLAAAALFSWFFPAYVFHNPQIPFNYTLLRKLGKLEPVRAFKADDPPHRNDTEYFTARQIFEHESGRSEEQLKVLNSLQKKLYIENYSTGDMIGYMRGNYEITDVRTLGDQDFFEGVALRARSIDFPNVILEYLMPSESPGDYAYEPGGTLRIGKAGSLAAILHLTHLPQDRLCVSVVSLNYLDRQFTNGNRFDVSPPKIVNLNADWPAFEEK